MSLRRLRLVLVVALALTACSTSTGASGTDSPEPGDAASEDTLPPDAADAEPDASASEFDASSDAGSDPDAGTPADASLRPDAGSKPDAGMKPDAGLAPDAGTPCTTTITYGNAWIRPAGHSSDSDVVSGKVTWDGACVASGANSQATLSNGWKPFFTGHGSCVIALDWQGCSGTPTACETRVTYGPAWMPPANHPASYDDVPGRLLWNGDCANGSTTSSTTLSNGWTPTFKGTNACDLSLRYEACSGLYANPVGPGCADPGVLKDGGTYYMVCTGGGATPYPRFTSTDLVHWTAAGHLFSNTTKPAWSIGMYWAPEIHKVGTHYVAYFTAQHTSGDLAIGAATASSPRGPFTDLGAPLVHPAGEGVIDATEFEDAGGQPYLVWKVDGNAVNQPTNIYAQKLNAAGTALTGTKILLITNDRSWEGKVTEGPWVIRHAGFYYLFYSGNSYANSTYAVGVARASNPLGPYTKFGPPIVTTQGQWIGPGHCSVVPAPSGEWALVYHAWKSGQVNTPGSERYPLVDTLAWSNGWPQALVAPTETSQPLP